MQKMDQIVPKGEPLALAGVDPITPEELRWRVGEGWRCVRFEVCISFLIATVRRHSPVYLTDSWQNRYILGMSYNAVSLLLGPWGVPWGLLWTARALWTNLTGGVDVTDELLERLDENPARLAEPS